MLLRFITIASRSAKRLPIHCMGRRLAMRILFTPIDAYGYTEAPSGCVYDPH